MTNFTDNSEPLKAYRTAAAELHEFSFVVEKKLAEAGEGGELGAAKKALSELSLRTKAFEELRARLTPLDLFIAKYGVVAIDDHSVSFVIPQGVSRIEKLKEAQKISIELHEANPEKYWAEAVVWPKQLIEWESKSWFIEEVEKVLLLRIDGNVKGSTHMTRAEQERKGWSDVAMQDLALAHTTFYLLTGKDISTAHTVRATYEALCFYTCGLIVDDDRERYGLHDISASHYLSANN